MNCYYLGVFIVGGVQTYWYNMGSETPAPLVEKKNAAVKTSVGRLVIGHLRSFCYPSSVIAGLCLNSFHGLKPFSMLWSLTHCDHMVSQIWNGREDK